MFPCCLCFCLCLFPCSSHFSFATRFPSKVASSLSRSWKTSWAPRRIKSLSAIYKSSRPTPLSFGLLTRPETGPRVNWRRRPWKTVCIYWRNAALYGVTQCMAQYMSLLLKGIYILFSKACTSNQNGYFSWCLSTYPHVKCAYFCEWRYMVYEYCSGHQRRLT